ncbi:MAG: type II secretion system protein GspL [Gammaproteobacteria bacterium]
MQTLLIHLLPDEPGIAEWMVAGTDHAVPHEAMRGPLTEAAEFANKRRVVLVVPTEEVLLTTAIVAVRNRQQLTQAIPYALEEGLAEDVERLHFALGPRQKGDVHPVAVVGDERMQQWARQLQEAGLQAHRFIPDVMLLPGSETRVTVLLQDGRALVRTSRFTGFACDTDTLPALIDQALETCDPEPESLVTFRCEDSDEPVFAGEPPLAIAEESACFTDFMGAVPDDKDSINLVQGSYQQGANIGHALRPWRTAAALLGAWLVVSGVSGFLEYRQLSQKNQRLTSAIEKEFRRSFPDVQRVVKPRVQMEQRLNSLRGASSADGATGFLQLLEAGGKAVTSATDVNIDNLTYRDRQLEVGLETSDLQALEKIKQQLQKTGLDAAIESADTRGDKVTARLRLKGAG